MRITDLLKRFRLPLLLGLVSALVFSGVVFAQEATPEKQVTDDQVNQVARELYCPICENTPLDVCETQACEDWRELIREKLAAGQSEQQIVDYFADVYGERARATPTTEGFSKWVWIVPLVGAVIGVAYFARLLQKWLARGTQADKTVPSPTLRLNEGEDDTSEVAEYLARLEREVRDTS